MRDPNAVTGNDIPNVPRDDVGRQEVYFIGGVSRAAIATSVDLVALPTPGRFNLNAQEGLASAEDDVVAIAVPPGLGDAEAHTYGFEHESKLGKFSALLSVKVGGWIGWIRRIRRHGAS